MVGPDGGQSSKSSWGFNIADQTDNLKWWGLDNSDGFNGFFLIEFSLSSVNISQNVSHTSFKTSEGSEVAFLGSVISGE